jgi:hypothetical protein
MKKILVLASFAAMAAASSVNAQTAGNFTTLNASGDANLSSVVNLNPGIGQKSTLKLYNWTGAAVAGTDSWTIVSQAVSTSGTEAPGVKFVQNCFNPMTSYSNTAMLIGDNGNVGI